MPTSPQLEVTGALNIVFRYTINGYQGQAPGVVLMNSDGAEVSSATAANQTNGNQKTQIVGPAGAVPTVGNPQGAVLSIAENALTVRGFPYYLDPSNNAVSIMLGNTAGQFVVAAPSPTAGGLTPYRRFATADTNLVNIKAAAGRVYGYVISNNTASAKFVKLYNKATAPVLATDVPVRTIMVPPNGIAAYHVGMGLGGFTAGISLAATGALGDTDTTALAANDLIIHIDYA